MCQNCTAVARTGCRLCPNCYAKGKVDKSESMVICQGCPAIAGRHFGSIRWEKMDLALAAWLFQHFEIRVERGAEDSASKWLSVIGWKGFTDVNEARHLTGTILSFAHIRSIDEHPTRLRPPDQQSRYAARFGRSFESCSYRLAQK
jgi:hypothetical protein